MIIRLIKKNKIYNFTLPNKVSGSYWVTDDDKYGNVRNLINVSAEDGSWRIKSDFETKIMSGSEEVSSAILKDYSMYFLKISTDDEYVILYCSPSIEKQIIKLKVNRNGDIVIGNEANCHINYNYQLVSKQNTKLTYRDGVWLVTDLNSKYGTYVNNEAISSKILEYGDIIFIMGLKIIVMEDYIAINNIGNLIGYDSNTFSIMPPVIQEEDNIEILDEDDAINFFKDTDYFFRAPRFKSKIEEVNISVEDPPGKEKPNEMPAIYTIGPMLTMAMSSVSLSFTSISGVIKGTTKLTDAMPTLVMSFAMVMTMLLWPTLSRNYQKKQSEKREKLRQQKYTEYVQKKHQEILSQMKIQRQILVDNYLPLDVVENIISSRKRNLWEREIKQEDFLDLRLGIGSTELKGNITFPQQRFMLDEDNLRDLVLKVASESRVLENVPISLSFVKNNISAIIGDGRNKQKFIEGLILQMMAFHSYEDLKIVLFTNEKNYDTWDYLKVLPHCWNNDKSLRYFATNSDEYKELSLALEKEIQHRTYTNDNKLKEGNYLDYSPYYFIITDDYKAVRDLEIIKDVCGQETNKGFSLCIISPRLTNLPNECKTFISIGDQKSGVFENELVSNKQKEFVADYDPKLNIYNYCKILCNIPIEIAKEEKNLPNSVTFLEMYNVGMIDQLNILNRWKTNDPTKSLQVPIGIDKNGDQFKLDLHEKYYGPHGLIAGMTGSGKSEFIITFILSMAINFHPYEVQFVLIDYKGGGLAGAFENKKAGTKLPHLVGTITNLDTIEMSRSLASINSELRRRQKMFNLARDTLGESTIDIYKYQRLYRDGKVKTPISHLFIISDEFAELKQQQPEFMDQLISTARIGRSLGVHLILATQKPVGVVDDQIWSNSKFKVCLKVQDKSDSMDMIKCPDAASLKNPGRFYLQVGYNELFALGQSAWCGAQYYPTEKRKKKIDTDIDFIDNVGNIVRSVPTTSTVVQSISQGEELSNIIKYIVKTADGEHVINTQLWLDRIPDVIYVEDLKKKYSFSYPQNDINLIYGEYDDPDNQKQNLLTLSLSNDGNTIIFGSTGSGKELLISSLIYSAITNYNPDEINFYILDFGAETLKSFEKAPQVGNVLTVNDSEKVENLFKLLFANLEERKKIFSDYNGSYNFYIEHSSRKIPLITVIINNYEAFSESFEDYEEILNQLTREGSKYGIVFILSTSSTNAIRYRMRQNFKNNICLQFNDYSDYSDVLTNSQRKVPSKVYGRGLVEMSSTYEFQTAYPYKTEKMADYIKVICTRLQQICKTSARKIPVLPDTVTIDDVDSEIGNLKAVPIGISKNDLNIATFDFKTNAVSVITGMDISEGKNLYSSLIKLFTKIPYKNVYVIDTMKLLEDDIESANYVSSNFEGIMKLISDSYTKQKETYEKNNYDSNSLTSFKKATYFIIGLSNLLLRISEEEKKILLEALSKAKEYGVDNYVIVDAPDKLKSFAYDEWYKSGHDDSAGIWIGNGITEQYIVKLLSTPRELREEIENGFGYVVVNGKATLVKFVSE